MRSEESNMSPPGTPLRVVKPALGSPWAGTYHSHRSQRVCRGHLQTGSLGGKTEERESEPQCAMGHGPAGPEVQGAARRWGPASVRGRWALDARPHAPGSGRGEGMKQGWLPREDDQSSCPSVTRRAVPLLLGGSGEPVGGTSMASSPWGQAHRALSATPLR